METLKRALKNIALAWWMLIVITIGILDARYGWQGLGRFFGWSWPLPWMIVATMVVTVVAIVLPDKGKNKNKN